ncbi:hypothetical protein ACFLZH_01400 [Patescibacteria group bacterium]
MPETFGTGISESRQAKLLAHRIINEQEIEYVRKPKEVPAIPEEYFDEDTPNKFKQLVREKLISILEAKKPGQMNLLAFENREAHADAILNEDVQELQAVFGEDVFRLGKNLEWYAHLCKGDVPSRLVKRFMKYIYEVGLDAAKYLNTLLKNKQFAANFKKAFEEVAHLGVIDPEIWKEIEDNEPDFFVHALCSYLGVHIGFQGLQHDELDRLKYPDLQRVRKFMLAGEGQDEEVEETTWEKWIKKWMPSQTERRSLDTMQPEIYITFDKGLFPGLSGKEQMEALKALNEALEKNGLTQNKLQPLGAVQIFDKAMRTSIARNEQEAREIGSQVVRLALGKENDLTFIEVSYTNPDDYGDRELNWHKVTSADNSSKAGLAVGWVFDFV